MIKCLRCGKEIEHANAKNAKYIMNTEDPRTWGTDKVEKIVEAPLTPERIQTFLKEKTAEQREFIVNEKGEVTKIIEHPFTLKDLDEYPYIIPDEYGRRQITIEESEPRPKTAIVCLDCLEEKDTVIW